MARLGRTFSAHSDSDNSLCLRLSVIVRFFRKYSLYLYCLDLQFCHYLRKKMQKIASIIYDTPLLLLLLLCTKITIIQCMQCFGDKTNVSVTIGLY